MFWTPKQRDKKRGKKNTFLGKKKNTLLSNFNSLLILIYMPTKVM